MQEILSIIYGSTKCNVKTKTVYKIMSKNKRRQEKDMFGMTMYQRNLTDLFLK